MASYLESALNRETQDECSRYIIYEGPPLQKSLLLGSIEKIQHVLENEHGIKLSSNDGWINKCREIVDVCIEQNLDVNLSETNQYSTLLHFVLENLYDDFQSVIRRVTNFDINARNDGFRFDEKRLLHMAVDNGRKNVVKILLELGADANKLDIFRRTPLFYAVSSAQLEVAEMLLKAGANVNAESEMGEMPIHKAFGPAKSNYSFNYGQNLPAYWELIELLSAYGAELNFNNRGGTEALCDACRGGSLKEVQFLLKHGANINSKNHQGLSPLHYAVLGNSVIFVDYLLSNGADLKAVNVDENSPILKLARVGYEIDYHAFDINPEERIGMIDFSGFSQGELEFTIQTLKMTADMIEYLADNGASVNVVGGNFKRSPLDLSVLFNSLEIAECLLELNANIDNSAMDKIYFFQYNDFVTINTNLHSDRVYTCVLLTVFIALRKDDISQYTHGLNEFHWVLPFLEKCKTEVSRMKSETICENRSVTLFDFLTQDMMTVRRFCRSEEIMSALESGKHKKVYPCYKYLLEKRMERVNKLRDCEKNFILYLEMYFERSLPLVIIDKIIDYLSASDLRNFGRALYLLKDCPQRNSLPIQCLYGDDFFKCKGL